MNILIIRKFSSQTLNLRQKYKSLISVWSCAKIVKKNVPNNLGINRHRINNLINSDVAA